MDTIENDLRHVLSLLETRLLRAQGKNDTTRVNILAATIRDIEAALWRIETLNDMA